VSADRTTFGDAMQPSGDPLFREWLRASAGDARLYDDLAALRIPMAWRSSVGRDRVRAGRQFYVPDQQGTPAFMLALYAVVDDGAFEVADILAFDQWGRWWRRSGVALVLTAAPVPDPWPPARPVAIHRDPLAWLRAGGDGLVVLDPDGIDYLIDFPALAAADLQLGRRLDRAIRERLRPPLILVPESVAQLQRRAG